MKIVIRCVLAFLVAVPFGAWASMPETTMLVPSRATVPELEKLSHQRGTEVDVLTVNREERIILLDGSGGNALTGRDIYASATGSGSEPVVRIPFDDLALVYYSQDGSPVKRVYPSLPEVGPADHDLNCDELDVDLARAGTVRWYARRQGAAPFTAHEARAQHGKNVLKGVGEVVLGAVMIAGCSGGSCPDFSGGSAPPSDPVSMQNYRWAVTAAEQRVLGLLQLKRNRSCAARDTRIAGETDLMVFAKIEDSRQALAEKYMTDQEQAHRQTVLLDQFDQVLPGTAQSDFAAAKLTFRRVAWYPDVDATESLKKIVSKPFWLGEIMLTDEELVFRPTSGNGAPMGEVVRLRYADLSDDVVTAHYGFRAVVGVTRRDGHNDTFEIDKNFGVDHKAMQAVVDFLKSKIPAASAGAH